MYSQKEIHQVLCAGAGAMGSSFAQIFARHGYEVILYDIFDEALERAEKLISVNQKAMVEAGDITQNESDGIMSRITMTTSKEYFSTIDFLLEATAENMDIKHSFFKEVSEVAKPEAMEPFATQTKEAENWTYAVEEVSIKKDAVNANSIKNSQFAKPYFEFSGACAGCGETPYIKLVSQLFGDRMYVANASGCSSAYGGSTPSSPYCTDKKGHGPAWAMSLFEDNAEYAYGFLTGQKAIQNQLLTKVADLSAQGIAKEACDAYLADYKNAEKSREVSDALLEAIENESSSEAQFIKDNKEFLTKKSVWAFGGDGWAYDIGYGGLDHVLASGEDINILVLDTEVYSNTGGQASKSTAASAVAKFAAGGKETKKKDLGMMAMSYGYVYVAQVALGSNPAQTLKAIKEAEAYDGPSLIICYCPCIEHGMKKSMGLSIQEEKNAVDAGYWHLYRFNPELKKEGKNPFTMDSKEPTGDFKEFLMGENRYASLALSFPEKAEELYAKAERDAKERLESYLTLEKKYAK